MNFIKFLLFSVSSNSSFSTQFTGTDPKFPDRGGTPTPGFRAKPIIWQDFSQKLHENKRNWTGGGVSLTTPWIRQWFGSISRSFVNHLPVSFAVRHHYFLLGRTVLQGVAAFPHVMHSVTVRNPVGRHCKSQVTLMCFSINCAGWSAARTVKGLITRTTTILWTRNPIGQLWRLNWWGKLLMDI